MRIIRCLECIRIGSLSESRKASFEESKNKLGTDYVNLKETKYNFIKSLTLIALILRHCFCLACFFYC